MQLTAMKPLESASTFQKLGRYLKDPGVSLFRKLAGVWALVYAVSPIDAVPDFIPLFGWLDDVGVLSIAAWFLVREVRRHTARLEAENPNQLR